MRRNAIVVFVVAAAALLSINVAVGGGADHAILSGNHPVAAETLRSLGNADLNQPLTMEIRFAVRSSDELDRLL